MKICRSCKIEKDESEYHKRSSTKNTLRSMCKKCANDLSLKWQKENKERVAERSKQWKARNPENSIEYSKKDYVKANCAAAQSRYRKSEQGKVKIKKYKASEKGKASGAKYNSKRRAAKESSVSILFANKEWNEFALNEIYLLSKEREKATNIKWHVDHIIPLNGKNVCGLHIPENLQVIPAIENLKKSNKFIG